MDYEWDPSKAKANLKKHGVDFADAVAVFSDSLALTIPDESDEEARFATLGSDSLGRVLVDLHVARRPDPCDFCSKGHGPGAQAVWRLRI